MATPRNGAYARLAVVGVLVLVATLLAASAAQAAVSISRAELGGTLLRIEGQAAANRTITVDGVAMGASDGSGRFRIERSGFAAPADCTVDVNDGSATAATARLSGCTVSSAPPPPPASASLSSLSLSPTAVVEGSTSTGTVTLTGPAPAGGLVVTLSSGNATAATVPESVTVAGGETSATFTIQAGSTAGSSSSVITASAGGVSRSATFTVNSGNPTLSNLSLIPLSVVGGSSSTGTVTLTAPATAGGVVVTLSSGNTSVATVPASVTVGEGASTATFTVATSPVTASTSVLITASHGSATRSFTLAVTPAATGPAVSGVTLSSSTVVGGTPVTGTVTLASAAPQGGTSVVLTSDNTNAATVPPSVTVASGATQATFPVETKPVTNSVSSTIVAEAGGARRGATITVTSQFNANNGSLSLARGGTGEGRIVSSPAGIDCTFTRTGTTGTCNNAFFPSGTRIRLDARPAANSRFLGWEQENSCRDAPNVTILAGVAHICRPAFALR